MEEVESSNVQKEERLETWTQMKKQENCQAGQILGFQASEQKPFGTSQIKTSFSRAALVQGHLGKLATNPAAFQNSFIFSLRHLLGDEQWN